MSINKVYTENYNCMNNRVPNFNSHNQPNYYKTYESTLLSGIPKKRPFFVRKQAVFTTNPL